MANLSINGKNAADEQKRLDAFTQLNQMPTEALERVAELSKNQKAVQFFTNPILFATLKMHLK